MSITVSGVPLLPSSCLSPCLNKFVADRRFGKGPDSCGELHVSHCRHISTLYFANLCLLIKGQRALKGEKKVRLHHTYRDRVSAERWKITRAHLTQSSLCGAKLGHFQSCREASTIWLRAYSDSYICLLFRGSCLHRIIKRGHGMQSKDILILSKGEVQNVIQKCF